MWRFCCVFWRGSIKGWKHLMAINPGTDLLSDALAAADPQRAKAAEERLARLAVQDGQDLTAGPQFEEVLASQSASPPRLATSTTALFGKAHPVGRGDPYEQFEVSVLKSLFEFMLPAKANSVYGSGFAGEVWRSMLADALAGVAGRAGVAGIARNLEARKHRVKPGARSKSS